MSIAVNDLAAVYRKLLASINVTPKSDGLLIQTIDDIEKQVLVESKPLALPTAEIVNNYTDSIVLFHPLCENLLLGESPVLQELRALIMDFLNDLILNTVDSVLSIAVDSDLISDLSPTQVDFMRSTSGADATTLKNWRAIMRRAESRGSANRVATIFLKRGAQLNSDTYKRVAIVNFNIYHELSDGKLNIFGAKIRKTDAKVYTKILESIFKDIDMIDEYSAGSNALTAPYFDALLRAYDNVLKTVNSVTWNLRKPIEQSTGLKLHVKDDFMECFKDLMKYRDVLPTMPLNDGDRQTRREEENPQMPDPKPEPIPVHELPGVSSLTRQSNPYYEPTSVSTQEPVQQPEYNQAPPQSPYGQPPQPNQAPVNFPSLQEQLAGVPLGGYQQQVYPPHNNFGQPQWGQPPQQMPMNGYPQYNQKPVWGQPPQQQWGQPQQQQQQWGQPQQQWGQPPRQY